MALDYESDPVHSTRRSLLIWVLYYLLIYLSLALLQGYVNLYCFAVRFKLILS